MKGGRTGAKHGSDSEELAGPKDVEELGNWGTSRRDYYDADVIETEADALEEEAEALKLQKKQLEGLTEADFGFDEAEWANDGKADHEDKNGGEQDAFREILPRMEITDAMGLDERMKFLTTRYPEFQPLAKEFLQLQGMHEDMQLKAAAANSVEAHLKDKSDSHLSSGTISTSASIISIKYSTISAYLGALSMYFAIFSSLPEDATGKREAMNPADLREHPIMETLIRCRGLWEKVKDVPVREPEQQAAAANQERDFINRIREPSINENHESPANGLHLPANGVNGGLSAQTPKAKPRKRKLSKAQFAAEAALVEADQRRTQRIQQTEENLKKLDTLTAMPPKSKILSESNSKIGEADDSDFGEETTLTAHEAAEKAKRKKSLRFYTSQIAQKASKRETAGRDAGGDADLPYRERLKDRQTRLNAEAEAKGRRLKSTEGDALGGESDEEDYRAAEALRADDVDEDYYDLIAARAQKKKVAKAALSAAQLQAAKEGGRVQVVEEIGPDGKRGITYAIEKNKGLIPKRKKDVRNPRVKKRKKYEDKKKKLGSIRQIYKGGEGRGGYGGELTGIKKGLIRSVKL